jgi:ribosomal protein S18 acetylase RimI-like enzyme
VKIVKATSKYLSGILHVMKIGATADHTALIKKSVKSGQCWIALVDSVVMGLAIFSNTSLFHQEFMELLIVHPEYRRKGVATALIKRLESLCKTPKFFTSTNQSNLPAQKTYEANGFIRSGYVENLDEGDPEIIYFKLLSK